MSALRPRRWPALLCLLLVPGCAQTLVYERGAAPGAGGRAAKERAPLDAAAGSDAADEPEKPDQGKAASRADDQPTVWRGTVHARAAEGPEPAEPDVDEAAMEPIRDEEPAPSAGRGFTLAETRRGWAWPVVGQGGIDGEVKRLPRRAFQDAQAGVFERAGCWRFTTRDGATWSAERWTLEAALRDHLVLRARGVPGSRVVDAQDLLWIVSPGGFPVELRDVTLRVRRMTQASRKRVIEDIYGTTREASVDELRYRPPRDAPPDVVFGVDRDGNAWPIDLAVIRGFVEMDDTSTIVLGSYRTVPVADVVRWEFDKEWGPWSVMLSPYLAARRALTNKPYTARCERFP